MTAQSDAVRSLMEHRQQLDADGIMVGVSRQALDEALQDLSSTAATLRIAEHWRDSAQGVGWLIERKTLTQSGFHFAPPMWWHPVEGWTHDADKALRFARREDAEALKAFHCLPDEVAFVSEHVWCGPQP